MLEREKQPAIGNALKFADHTDPHIRKVGQNLIYNHI